MIRERQNGIPDTARKPEEESELPEGCTARFDPDTKILSVSIFGKEIISEKIAGPDENDYWIGYDDGDRNVDFNISLNGQTNRYELVVYPVVDGRTDGTTWQSVPLAFDLAGEIKNLLRLLGKKELDLVDVEQPSMALWWDNKGRANETTVLAAGIDDKDDLYLTLDDGCGADVQIWESYGQLSDNDLKLVLENIREYMARPVKTSFRELAERAFALPAGETISFFCQESLDSYAWGIAKTRQLDADLIVVGIYGGGMTFMYDLTGDPDAGELAGFLRNILSSFTPEGVWLKPRE